ncbi:MAG TPA: sporulation integral membrane protein YtvI [Candidatus Dorea intestinavium]|nr:sporulation integral membrane protein YtvI [Candidatus Dorea intestinavium]
MNKLADASKDNRPTWKVILSFIFGLLGTIAFFVVGVGLLKFLMPFVIGWFIAYIANPLVNWLERRLKIVKKLSSVVIIIVVLAGIAAAIYFASIKIYKEVAILVNNMPAIFEQSKNVGNNILDSLYRLIDFLPSGVADGLTTFVDNLGTYFSEFVKDLSIPTVTMASNVAKRIPSIIIYIFFIVISAFFFISKREELIILSRKWTPEPILKRVSLIITNFKYAMGGYFKAQFKIMGVVFAILFIGFIILKVPFYALLAILIAFLDFLPFFGTGTALLPWALYQLIVKDYKMAIGLVIIYAVTQGIRQLIQPKLVGDSMGLDPLMTLFFLFIGYRLGSVVGMILAVPIGLILINLIASGSFNFLIDDGRTLVLRIANLRKQEPQKKDEDHV